MPSLYDLSEGIRKCISCPLWKFRFLAVPGEGSANAKLFFIGEAPGVEEDKIGLPFVGRSGKFLDELLKEAGIPRESVFITEAVKCRPEKNRKPSASELKACRELWLNQQLEIIKPKLIVVLGGVALKSLLPGKQEKRLSQLHGKTVEKQGQKYFVTYHPAAGMRFPKINKLMKKDFEKLWKILLFI